MQWRYSYVGNSALASALTTTSIIALSIALAGSPAREALAQGAQTSSSSQIEEIEEVVVTGSRIARRDFVANSPIVTVTDEELLSFGSVELEQILNYLPHFTPGATAFQTSVGGSNFGQATLNLRGLGATRNLVLLDGKRAQPSTATLQIDINTIPSALIESVEVISGGASAVYGSDAMSGVINFKLKRDFDGVQASAQYGFTEEDDGTTKSFDVTMGSDFASGRGNAVVAVTYYDRERIRTNTRDFFARALAAGRGSNIMPLGVYQPNLSGPIGPATLAEPFFLPSGNQPSAAALAALFNGVYGVTGTFPNSTNLSFNPDGTLFTQNNGIRNYNGPGLEAGYGPNTAGNQLIFSGNALDSALIQNPMTRYSFFANVNYQLTENINLFSQGLFTSYETLTQQTGALASFNVWNLIIPVTNPFIPDDLATLLASRPQPDAPFGLSKLITQFGPQTQEHNTSVYQIQVGATGNIPGQDWTWEVYGSHGKTQLDSPLVSGAALYSLVEQLLFAPDGAASLCEGGYNPFGDNPASEECAAFATRKLLREQPLTQDVVEVTLQGGLFQLPAGELRFAAGAGYRSNEYDLLLDSNLTSTLPTAEPIANSPSGLTSGKTDVSEFYGELLIPLLRDVPLVQALEVIPAYRYSDYDTFGGVSTYKADFNWAVNSQFRMRGGYQRAIRAPNIGELFAGPVASPATIGTTVQGLGDPCDVEGLLRSASNPDAAQVRALCLAQGVPLSEIDTFTFTPNQVGGQVASNSNLTPEKANTYTIGAVWQPQFESPIFDQFTLAIDYYDITIKEAVNTISGVTALRNCFNALNSNPTYDPGNVFCQQVVRANGQIINLVGLPVNSGGIKTDGIDFQAIWGIGLGTNGADQYGSVLLNLQGTHLGHFEIATLESTPFIDYQGTLGGPSSPLPSWKWYTTLTYMLEPVSVGLRWRYIGSMDDDSVVTNPTNPQPGVPSYSTLDLFGRWEVSDSMYLGGGIDNLFDKSPLETNGLAGSTDSSVYDVIGRRFYVSVTARF
jgi:outer membrane receptor protein involved in Fe transport